MPRESNAVKRARAIEVCKRLNDRYGPVECFLDHANPFRLLISVLLSAQTTDAQVNKVTPELFRRWPTPEAMAGATPSQIAEVIKSLGFYKTKAKHCVEAAQMIVADYGGEVPADMKELVKIPGVGRKTANIVLNVGFGIVEGIAVDTHVNRIAHRLALSPKTHAKEPLKTEQDLLKILPREYWNDVNHQWISFGRETLHRRCRRALSSQLSYPTGRASRTKSQAVCTKLPTRSTTSWGDAPLKIQVSTYEARNTSTSATGTSTIRASTRNTDNTLRRRARLF